MADIALAGGHLKLIAGSGAAGLLIVQAIRRLQQLKAVDDADTDICGAVSVAVVAPTAWAAPLPLYLGSGYPRRLARRQQWGWAAFQMLAACGVGKVVAQQLVPAGSSVRGADPAMIVAWWLGLLDPVLRESDVARELLLGTRHVDPTAGQVAFKKLLADAAAEDDDADDDSFAVGPTRGPNAQPEETGSSQTSRSAEEQRLATPVRPFLGKALPMLLLLPPEMKAANALQAVASEARSKMLKAMHGSMASTAATSGEIALLQYLLELSDADLRAADPSKTWSSPSPSFDQPEVPDSVLLTEVSRALPLAFRSMPGALTCPSEHSDLIAQVLADFVCKGRLD
eukprot:gnl/TRDRNA2_/TRDRNA2_86359_c0_seq1.p1 gnl/TRDRNA2_/TRDRNA2_86359_c0~~gnl/TRDRNA2_/TRDRNA2_86359_c0_seq1.p1  ORF type:complete len:396 (-),score=67.53 gnl/TRDRNA2_/TRDRNA2_86359_c0_seq1:140-1165(-)